MFTVNKGQVAKMVKKALAMVILVLIICSTMPLTALAASFSDMPSNWSTTALQSAVDNGLLHGSGGNILPRNNLTRAEMATIINRAFGASVQSSLSAFSDVKANKWYAADMAKAVQMKTFLGSKGKLNPDDFITREEVFVVMARAMKLDDGSEAVLNKFSDANKISTWARGAAAAMTAAGYISGSNGKINPGAYITRAEFAQIMYNAIKTYIKTAGTYTSVATGNVMINVPEVTLKGITVKGDLIIGDGVGTGNVTLDAVKITGRTVVRGGGRNSIHVINGSSISGTVIIDNVNNEVRIVTDSGTTVQKIEAGSHVVLEGSFGEVKVVGDTSGGTGIGAIIDIKGNVQTLLVDAKAEVNLISGTVQTVTVARTAPGTGINTVQGARIDTITANAQTSIAGSGTVTSVQVKANNVKVDTAGTKVTVDSGVTGVTAGGIEVPAGTTKVTASTPSITDSGNSNSSNTGDSSTPAKAKIHAISVTGATTVIVTLDKAQAGLSTSDFAAASGTDGLTFGTPNTVTAAIAGSGNTTYTLTLGTAITQTHYVKISTAGSTLGTSSSSAQYFAPSSSVTPTTTSYDKNGGTAPVIALTLNGNTLIKINDGSKDLVLSTDYTVSGSNYTLTSAYLNSLSAGNHTLTFIISEGSAPTVVLTISDSTVAVSSVSVNNTNPTVGNIISANVTMSDAQPAGSRVTYQWQSSDNGTTWTDITGASSASYTVAASDEAKRLHVVVTGVSPVTGTMTSSATNAVAQADTTPPTLSNGTVEGLGTPTGSTAILKYQATPEAGTVKIYKIVQLATATTPTVTNVKANFSGTTSGNPTYYQINLTGLTAGQSYKAYIVMEDASGNTSNMLIIDNINPYSNASLAKLDTPSVTLASDPTYGLSFTVMPANGDAQNAQIKEYSVAIATSADPNTILVTCTVTKLQLTGKTGLANGITAGVSYVARVQAIVTDNNSTYQSSDFSVNTSAAIAAETVKPEISSISVTGATTVIVTLDKAQAGLSASDFAAASGTDGSTFGTPNTVTAAIAGSGNTTYTLTLGTAITQTHYIKISAAGSTLGISSSSAQYIAPSSSVTPTTASYDKNGGTAPVIALTLNGNTLIKINDGSKDLALSTDYTVSGSNYTLTSTYLNSLSAGNHTLTFTMSAGIVPQVVLTISDTTVVVDSIGLNNSSVIAGNDITGTISGSNLIGTVNVALYNSSDSLVGGIGSSISGPDTARAFTIYTTTSLMPGSYKVYVLINGVKSSIYADLTMVPVEIIPPTLSNGTVEGLNTYYGTGAILKFQATEEAGTVKIYKIVQLASDAPPTVPDVIAVPYSTASGNPIYYQFNLGGLTAGESYKAYIVMVDASYNVSNMLIIDNINPFSNASLPVLDTPSVTLTSDSTYGLSYTVTPANSDAQNAQVKEYYVAIATSADPNTELVAFTVTKSQLTGKTGLANGITAGVSYVARVQAIVTDNNTQYQSSYFSDNTSALTAGN